LGQEITHIRALTHTFEKPTAAEDAGVAIMVFSGGALGTLQASWAHHPDVVDSVTIDGEHGSLFVPSDPDAPVRVVERAKWGGVLESSIHGEPSGGPGWIPTIKAFVDAINLGLESPVPGTEGKATLEAILQAYASVSIEYP
jgi:predicted dehydrogenase